MLPYGKQDIRHEDINAVVDVLKSDLITQGDLVPKFESSVAEKVGAAHGVAVNSATSALHIAYMAAGLRPGGLLWTVPNTFVATANAALYCGADVDFVDVDPRTYNMSVDSLEEKLKIAERIGRIPDLVVPVHFAGQPCDMKQIRELGDEYGFRIIEDASHAIGASYQSEQIGACQFSDITVFSFHPVKIITTGEGGMALSNNPELVARMVLLRSHGVTRSADLIDKQDAEAWYYEQIDLGFNYRMTEMQAALGISQLSRLDEYVDKRHSLAKHYDALLGDAPLVFPYQTDTSRSAYHLYPVMLSNSDQRRFVFDRMRSRGIGVNVHYIPVHTQPWYKSKGFNWGDYAVAEDYYSRTMSLPLFPQMGLHDVERVVAELRYALSVS